MAVSVVAPFGILSRRGGVQFPTLRLRQRYQPTAPATVAAWPWCLIGTRHYLSKAAECGAVRHARMPARGAGAGAGGPFARRLGCISMLMRAHHASNQVFKPHGAMNNTVGIPSVNTVLFQII